MAIGGLHQEGKQRQRATFAVVVGAQQKEHVFDGDDDRQRPDHQGNEADDLETGETIMGDRLQRFAERIKRARADIPVNDTYGA